MDQARVMAVSMVFNHGFIEAMFLASDRQRVFEVADKVLASVDGYSESEKIAGLHLATTFLIYLMIVSRFMGKGVG